MGNPKAGDQRMSADVRDLHKQGYHLVVTDNDGHEFVFDWLIDFSPIWDDGEITAISVETENHPMFIFDPLPESICFVRRDTL